MLAPGGPFQLEGRFLSNTAFWRQYIKLIDAWLEREETQGGIMALPTYCFGAKEPLRNRSRIKGVNQRGNKAFQNSVLLKVGRMRSYMHKM